MPAAPITTLGSLSVPDFLRLYGPNGLYGYQNPIGNSGDFTVSKAPVQGTNFDGDGFYNNADKAGATRLTNYGAQIPRNTVGIISGYLAGVKPTDPGSGDGNNSTVVMPSYITNQGSQFVGGATFAPIDVSNDDHSAISLVKNGDMYGLPPEVISQAAQLQDKNPWLFWLVVGSIIYVLVRIFWWAFAKNA